VRKAPSPKPSPLGRGLKFFAEGARPLHPATELRRHGSGLAAAIVLAAVTVMAMTVMAGAGQPPQPAPQAQPQLQSQPQAQSPAPLPTAQTPAPPVAPVAGDPYAPAIARLEKLIAHEMQDKALPAVSIALVDDQRIVWSKGFGYADPARKLPATADTVYRVGSVSKLFTDIAVMQLVERGQVDLDAPVTTYLPSFKPANPFGTPITLRHLMSHRAGLVREPPVGHYFDDTAPTLAATVDSLNRTTLVYAPGTRTKYSNAGIAVVGRVLEVIAKRPFADALRDRVLAPLGLQKSAFAPTPAVTKDLAKAFMWTYHGTRFDAPTFQLGMAPAGSMYSTVNDLARFMSALFQRGATLKPETLEAMWKPQFAPPQMRSGYGLGFDVSFFDGQRRVGHSGAIYGFATDVQALPDSKLGVAIVTTLDCTNPVMAHIGQEALRAMVRARDKRPEPELVLPTALTEADAKKWDGVYEADNNRGRIALRKRGPGPRLLASLANIETNVTLAGTQLLIDGPLAYGAFFTPRGDDAFEFESRTYRRVPKGVAEAKPTANAYPARWNGLIGEYGWDHDVLYILEREGKLHALIEWFYLYPIDEVAGTGAEERFAFPKSGLYDGEQIRFIRPANDADGPAIALEISGLRFNRRPVGVKETTFKITPRKPVAALRKIAAAAKPPAEAGKRAPDLVELSSLDATIKYDIRYATTNNFMSTAFYRAPRALMQRPAAEAVARAHKALREHGYGLLIHDAYRPWTVTKMFWEATPDAQRMFVADPAQGSRHNRGCAVDLTLYDLATGRPVQMTGGYDEFSDRSYPDYPGGTSLQRWHRELLRRTMEAEGFTVFETEWWHFDFNTWREYPILNVAFEQLPGERAAVGGPSAPLGAKE
jgi:CubicO group peptidase (beta-lactamase class C family)/D-alanyl-D-alanine dipeptidase